MSPGASRGSVVLHHLGSELAAARLGESALLLSHTVCCNFLALPQEIHSAGKWLLLPHSWTVVPHSQSHTLEKEGERPSFLLLPVLFGHLHSRLPGPLIRTLNLHSSQTSCLGPVLPEQLSSAFRVLVSISCLPGTPVLGASLLIDSLSPRMWS